MRLRWRLLARPDQLTPPGDWLIWFIRAGRGWGKTRVGAEDSADYARKNAGVRIAIVAPTFAVGRDVCVEGESGLLKILHEDEIAHWNRSEGALVLRNGSRWKIYSSTEPERLRGPQHHRAWCEEFGAWVYPQETWDMLMFGLRLGSNPQVVITTTPRPYKLLKELVARATTHVTSGSTFDNAKNLSPIALAELEQRYGNTHLGRQELYGEIIDDVDGAIWRRATIEATRAAVPEHFDKIAVSVDIAATSKPTSDETGVIVAGRVGKASDGHVYVLDDLSLRAPPEVWGAVIVHAYLEYEADVIIYETNMGGELVASVIKAAAVAMGVPTSRLHLTPVHAARGKRTRAEPIGVMYTEQGGMRVHHTRAFPELEDQMCTWVPGDDSPDRMDALVWNITHLLEGTSKRRTLHYAP
jgi:phage terminase large subunit-like protein